jgi:hypothetical protein
METSVLVVLALVVALVAIDAIARLDERGGPKAKRPQRRDGSITTQKIIVDLSKRH